MTVQFSPNCTQTSHGIFRLHFRLLFAHWSQAMRFRPRFSHCSFGGAVEPDSARCLQVFQCRMSASLLIGVSCVEDVESPGIRPGSRILTSFQRSEDKSGRRTGERRCLRQFNQYTRRPRLEATCHADTYEIGRVGGGDLNKRQRIPSQPIVPLTKHQGLRMGDARESLPGLLNWREHELQRRASVSDATSITDRCD